MSKHDNSRQNTYNHQERNYTGSYSQNVNNGLYRNQNSFFGIKDINELKNKFYNIFNSVMENAKRYADEIGRKASEKDFYNIFNSVMENVKRDADRISRRLFVKVDSSSAISLLKASFLAGALISIVTNIPIMSKFQGLIALTSISAIMFSKRDDIFDIFKEKISWIKKNEESFGLIVSLTGIGAVAGRIIFNCGYKSIINIFPSNKELAWVSGIGSVIGLNFIAKKFIDSLSEGTNFTQPHYKKKQNSSTYNNNFSNINEESFSKVPSNNQIPQSNLGSGHIPTGSQAFCYPNLYAHNRNSIN